MLPRLLFSFLLLSGALARLDGEVAVEPLFTDHAVLQCGMPVPVWGTASPGEAVAVLYQGQEAHAIADEAGHWQVRLAPLQPGASGDLVVRGSNELKFSDVASGEVWICGGQSNMAIPVSMALHPQEEIAAANDPRIRQFQVGLKVSTTPVDSLEGKWVPCSPQTAGKFTAVGFFFARELQKKINLPIGLISVNKGGSPVEAWMSAAAFAHNEKAPAARNYFEAQSRRVLAAAKPPAEAEPAESNAIPAYGPGGYATPSGLFGGMLHPLIPYAMRGVLWYQGETNVPLAADYGEMFRGLIEDWRAQWNEGEFPFLYVQLPNIGDKTSYDRTGNGWPLLRDAQRRALAVPHAGMAVTIDVGDTETRHPANKQEVGRRLALIALGQVYNSPEPFSGPLYRSCEIQGSKAILRFDYSDGLGARGDVSLEGFEIAGEDRHFRPAQAVIQGGNVEVSQPETVAPVAVRYGWKNNPATANLSNATGLPASPFRTDSW